MAHRHQPPGDTFTSPFSFSAFFLLAKNEAQEKVLHTEERSVLKCFFASFFAPLFGAVSESFGQLD